MKEQFCYLNGAILPLSEAKVGILDLGLLRGFGIYEGIAAIHGAPFRFSDHWERFEKSAQKLGLALPATGEQVEAAMRDLIARNTDGDRANIRLVLTGGEAVNGIGHVEGHETLFIIVEPFTPLPQMVYEKGASLITHNHLRFMPGIKTIHYITAVMVHKKQKEAGAIETLYTHDGMALECSTSNIFIVKDGVLFTPEENILKGITRKVVLEVAQAVYPIKTQIIPLSDVFNADEVFIVSSFKDIVPIISIDGKQIGSGLPGPVTKDLMQRFEAYTEKMPSRKMAEAV